MKRWLAIKASDGSIDKYAVALVTHTVARTYDDGKPIYQAWRFDTEPATLIGTYHDSDLAKLACESDSKRKAA